MKKLILGFLVISLFTCNTGFATTILSPVKWKLGTKSLAGGIKYQNTSNRKQYVQVAIERGSINSYTATAKTIDCESWLEADTDHVSTICQLDPDASLYIDLNKNSGFASGTYQIAVVDN